MQTLAYIFLLISFVSTDFSTLWPSFFKEVYSILGAILFIYASKTNIKINSYTKFLILLIVFSIISFPFTQIYFEKSAIFLYYVLLSLLITSAVSNQSNNIDEEKFFLVIILSCFANFIAQLIQMDYIKISILNFPKISDRPFGTMGQPNHLGTLYAIALIPLIAKKITQSKFLILFLVSIFSVGIALTGSRAALLSVLSMFLISLLNSESRKNLSPLLMLALSTILVFTFTYNTRPLIEQDQKNIGSGRFEIWQMLTQAVAENPWVGYGIGNTPIAQFDLIDKYPSRAIEIMGHSHNFILELFLWFGIPLATILIIHLIIIFTQVKIISNRNIKYTLSLTPLLVHSMLEYPLHYFYLLFIFSYLVGRLEIKSTKTIKLSAHHLRITGILLLFSLTLGFIDYKRLQQAQRLQAITINKTDQKPIDYILYDESATYVNLLKSIETYSYEDYVKLKYLTKKNPIELNFKKIIRFSESNNPSEMDYWENKYNLYKKN